MSTLAIHVSDGQTAYVVHVTDKLVRASTGAKYVPVARLMARHANLTDDQKRSQLHDAVRDAFKHSAGNADVVAAAITRVTGLKATAGTAKPTAVIPQQVKPVNVPVAAPAAESDHTDILNTFTQKHHSAKYTMHQHMAFNSAHKALVARGMHPDVATATLEKIKGTGHPEIKMNHHVAPKVVAPVAAPKPVEPKAAPAKEVVKGGPDLQKALDHMQKAGVDVATQKQVKDIFTGLGLEGNTEIDFRAIDGGGFNLSAQVGRNGAIQLIRHNGVVRAIYDLTYRRNTPTGAFRQYGNEINDINSKLTALAKSVPGAGTPQLITKQSAEESEEYRRQDGDEPYSETEQGFGAELKFNAPDLKSHLANRGTTSAPAAKPTSESAAKSDDFKQENFDTTKKALRVGKKTLAHGTWAKEGKAFHATVDGKPVHVKFYSTTSYKNSGRLRIASGTKYQVWAELSGMGDRLMSFDFGSTTGEGQTSNAKVAEYTAKAQAFAKKTLGLDLGQFDFAH